MREGHAARGGRGHFIGADAGGRARSRARRHPNLAGRRRAMGRGRRLASAWLFHSGPGAHLGGGRDRRRAALPWLAVAFGTGIVLYFAADREPAL
jgi:hypothetical protein